MKKHHTTAYLLILACLFTGKIASTHAETTVCTVISQLPYNIERSGVYCLRQNLDSNLLSGYAIRILADNVVLDLNGHSISNLAAGQNTSAYGIYASNRRAISIKNGRVTGYFTGIYLTTGRTTILDGFRTSEHSRVESMSTVHNYYAGISVAGSYSTLKNNKVAYIGGSNRTLSARGIYVNGSAIRVEGNVVHKITAQSNGSAIGIYYSRANNSIGRKNQVSSVVSQSGTTYAIRIANSRNLMLRENHLTHIEDYGIYFDTTSSGRFTDTITHGIRFPYQTNSNARGIGINTH